MKNLKNEVRNEMVALEYENEQIEQIMQDEHMLKWIEHCINNPELEANTVAELFEDVGFIEGLDYQLETPITFEEMIGE